MPEASQWVDDPIRSAAEDTLNRSHIAAHAARLINNAHSWDTSVVFGLTGPWGSGKTSMATLIIEELQKTTSANWRVARFTPWATSDTASMMSEFFSSLSATLPSGRAGKRVRQTLQACATVSVPLLTLIPFIGGTVGEGAKLFGQALSKSKPWDEAFAEASAELKKLQTPVLVLADDIDRLQADELVALLKVVRLLGRFPGVHYLLAYDEQTLLVNLQQAGIGVDDSQRARLFMEKIVQYSLTVPPLLPTQMLLRLDTGLTSLLLDLERPSDPKDHRLSQLTDVLQSQLSTPRSIERFLAQVRHYLPMHRPEDINDVDLILLTFLHMQFPELYDALPRWRALVTGSRQAMRVPGNETEESLDWEKLLANVPTPSLRPDAEEVLRAVFPRARQLSGRRAAPSVCVAEYFDRYFAHTIPEGDIADAAVHSALVEASVVGLDAEALKSLLTDPYPGRADLAIQKFRKATAPVGGPFAGEQVNLQLIQAVAGCLEDLEDAQRTIFGRQEQCIYWLSELLRRLPESTHKDDVVSALAACRNWKLRLQVMQQAIRPEEDDRPLPFLVQVAAVLAREASDHILEHLRLRDGAAIGNEALIGFMFVDQFGDANALRDLILERLNLDFSLEDLASRFVSVNYLIGPTPTPRLGDFDVQRFAKFAPREDPFYEAPREPHVDEWDVSWTNMRAYVRGRAIPSSV